jgi:hypothetical protein
MCLGMSEIAEEEMLNELHIKLPECSFLDIVCAPFHLRGRSYMCDLPDGVL